MLSRTVTLGLLSIATAIIGTHGNAVGAEASALWRPGIIDEIIITARKREEPAFLIPMSVTTIGSDELAVNEVVDVHDLADTLVNFNMNPSNGRQSERPTIRGQSNVLGAPNAAFFIDGNYVNAESAIAGQLMGAVERIEVLRGPQVSLYGRSTLAGAVNYVTRDPGDDLSGSMTVGAGSYGSHQLSMLISGPLLEDRLSFLVYAGEAFVGSEWRNTLADQPPSPIFPGAPTKGDRSRLGEESTQNVLGKLVFETEDTRLSLTAHHTTMDDSHYAVYAIGADELNCKMPVAGTETELSRGYYCGEVSVAGRSMSLNIPDIEQGLIFGGSTGPGASPGNERETSRLAVRYDYDLRDWTLTSNLSWSKDTHQLAEDSDHTGGRPSLFFFNGTVILKETEDKAAELRLSSPELGALRGGIGLYYYDQRHTDQRRTHYAGFAPAGDPERIKNSAIFGNLEFDATEALTLSLEARYARERIFLSDSIEESFESFTPRFSATYQIRSESLVYGNIAKGTKPGGFNTDFFKSTVHPDALAEAYATGRATIDEEEAWNYEVGYKVRLPEQGLFFKADIYYIDWSDQQLTSIAEIQQTNLTVKSVPIIVNLGESTIKGFEIEAGYQPNANWQFGLSYGLAMTEIDKGNDPVDEAALSGFDDPDFLQGGNLHGRELPNAPKHSANTFVQYDRQLRSGWQGFARLSASYESKKYAQVHNLAHTGDRLKIDFKLGLLNDTLSLEFYGKNVFDDDTPVSIIRYVDFVSPSGPNGRWRGFSVIPQRGQEFGLTLRRLF
ncbi:MAG: TonB-dependent receptor [Alphaproteobacteria bacterium]|nr:MAG: TonB-dependent receptor [Alphaproteobacteria bacterium]